MVREKTPSAQETFLQMAQAAGLRGRLLVTIGLLVLVRLGIFIPVPGIDRQAFANFISSSGNSSIVGFLDIFTGGGISALGIFALGILPFINASIIMQLLATAIPSLEDLQKNEGEAGRRKISQITRYVALGGAIIQSFGLTLGLLVNNRIIERSIIPIGGTVLALTAGSMFVMWISEIITERGIGNGASLLIFVNIVAVLPKTLATTIEFAQSGGRGEIAQVIVLLLVFLTMIVGIVFIQEGTRRIPIISARRQVGRRVYRERSNYLPLRLNQGGVMPIIFASSVLFLPAQLLGFLPEGSVKEVFGKIATAIQPGNWAYVAVYLVLILFFSYFYASLIVNPVDMSQNLKKMGASIPGIRPGKATSTYLEKVLNRLTLLGAIFLGIVATVPTLVESAIPAGTTVFSGFGATSLLILVGVAIDTAKQIQTYVISQRYEGMVKQ
jgi:preprotein translocase subunit SecY